MNPYIAVADVDAALGVSWATNAGAKAHAVMVANVWMTNLGLRTVEPLPDEFKQAGAQIAREAAEGRIYGVKETGVLSQSVQAGDVSSSKTFSGSARTYTAGENLALALLKPWLPDRSGVMFLKRS